MGHTCGYPCWTAAEDICRCSCNGANHGCLRRDDGVQPIRTALLDGVRRELAAIGPGTEEQARELNAAAGIKYIYAAYSRDRWDCNIPARIRLATRGQVARWSELAAWRNGCDRDRPYLLWIIPEK